MEFPLSFLVTSSQQETFLLLSRQPTGNLTVRPSAGLLCGQHSGPMHTVQLPSFSRDGPCLVVTVPLGFFFFTFMGRFPRRSRDLKYPWPQLLPPPYNLFGPPNQGLYTLQRWRHY